MSGKSALMSLSSGVCQTKVPKRGRTSEQVNFKSTSLFTNTHHSTSLLASFLHDVEASETEEKLRTARSRAAQKDARCGRDILHTVTDRCNRVQPQMGRAPRLLYVPITSPLQTHSLRKKEWKRERERPWVERAHPVCPVALASGGRKRVFCDRCCNAVSVWRPTSWVQCGSWKRYTRVSLTSSASPISPSCDILALTLALSCNLPGVSKLCLPYLVLKLGRRRHAQDIVSFYVPLKFGIFLFCFLLKARVVKD